MARDSAAGLPPYFNIDPDHALAELDPPTGTEGFARIAGACARGRADLASRGLNAAGQRRLRLFSTWEITRYLIPVAQAHFRRVLKQHPELPQGRSETEGGAKWFTLDEVLRAARLFRRPGLQGQGLPALPPRRAAGEDGGGGQFQGRRRQDLDRGASGDVGGTRRLQGAGRRSRQPGLDDLDLRRPGRGRVADRLPAAGAPLRRASARRQPAPTGPRRGPRAAGRGADRRPGDDRARRDPAHPLAEHRPDRGAAEPLLGRVPDPGLADGGARLEALGCAQPNGWPPTGCWSITIWCSSTPPLPWGI